MLIRLSKERKKKEEKYEIVRGTTACASTNFPTMAFRLDRLLSQREKKFVWSPAEPGRGQPLLPVAATHVSDSIVSAAAAAAAAAAARG